MRTVVAEVNPAKSVTKTKPYASVKSAMMITYPVNIPTWPAA